jgi:hypothetical protein
MAACVGRDDDVIVVVWAVAHRVAEGAILDGRTRGSTGDSRHRSADLAAHCGAA